MYEIKFNLTFRLKGIRSMYSGTVSLEYHADVSILPLPYLSALPSLQPLRSARPGRDARRHRFTIVSIPLSRPGVFLSSLCALPIPWDISTELKKMSFPFFICFLYLFIFFYIRVSSRENSLRYIPLYIIIYNNVKNHGPLNRT